MLVLVIINTCILFVSGFFPDKDLLFIDSLFTAIFLLEAIAKIHVHTFQGYWADGWNRFDFIIVMLALPSIVNLFGDVLPGTNILLSLRILRAFKSFRLFQFIPNIEEMVNGIRRAAQTTFIVILGLVVLLTVFSIITTFLFGELAPQYFGNPALSVYSLFRLFTIEGWYEMPDAIARHSGIAMAFFARVYFSVLLFLGGIIGMSLVNSIFVDAMVADNNDEVLKVLERLDKEIKQLRQERTGQEVVTSDDSITQDFANNNV